MWCRAPSQTEEAAAWGDDGELQYFPSQPGTNITAGGARDPHGGHSTNPPETISDPVCQEGVGQERVGGDVGGQGDPSLNESLGVSNSPGPQERWQGMLLRRLPQVSKANFDTYPMPRVEEMFESIGAAKVISTLDLAKGYWQIPMSPSSREKTAFATPFGLFEFDVMPFGLHNAPATFQRLMNHILRDCQSFARAYYIDDIVIFSQSWEEHVRHLSEVFKRLAANLRVKLEKCPFGCVRAHYLGHVIGQGKVEPEEGKVAAVRDYPTPITKRDVQAFLGLVGYYRHFVPHFAEIACLCLQPNKEEGTGQSGMGPAV